MKEPAGSGPQLDAFAERIAELPCRMGQILITREAAGGFDLRHRDDAERNDLVVYERPDGAMEIVRYDDAGKYRPLKTAPNLRHGWRLSLGSMEDVRLAMDFFYPGRIAAFLAEVKGTLATTPLRETLERQTGIYRVAAQITREQADDLVGRFCRSGDGCLRTILWNYDAAGTPATRLSPEVKFDPAHDQTGRGERVVPLLCQEACNLLVAEARKVVKSETA